MTNKADNTTSEPTITARNGRKMTADDLLGSRLNRRQITSERAAFFLKGRRIWEAPLDEESQMDAAAAEAVALRLVQAMVSGELPRAAVFAYFLTSGDGKTNIQTEDGERCGFCKSYLLRMIHHGMIGYDCLPEGVETYHDLLDYCAKVGNGETPWPTRSTPSTERANRPAKYNCN